MWPIGTPIDPMKNQLADEEEERFLDVLERVDPLLREVAIKRMNGFTKTEIASELKVSIWAIQRMLQKMREIWNRRNADHD
jgi:DNA-directed RNA polymerase specialized sigma24 family protein